MVTAPGVVSATAITHRQADVETLAAAAPDDPGVALDDLLAMADVQEAFVLSTCNRVEFYVVTDTASIGRGRLDRHLNQVPAGARRALRHDEAIEHLCRVASGLESQVLGEDEVLGQVRDAFHLANDRGALGPVLEPALLKALHVGERARTETAINEGVVSLASAAVRLADGRLHLPRATAVVVGAGDAGRRTARALAAAGVDHLVLANRSQDAAEAVGRTIGVDATVDLDDLGDAIAEADLLVTATASSSPVIGPEHVPRDHPLLVVDLGQPQDVSPSVRNRANVAYYDLDRLRIITDRTHEQRTDAAAAVERLIEREVDELHRQFKRDRAEEVIAAMRAGADGIKRHELERAVHRLEHGDAPTAEIVEDLADALVNAIMAAPTEALRDAAEEDDWATINAAIYIFDPSLDAVDLPADLVERQGVPDD
ncbi:MAG: glutamyl-tRNA reductase [Halobacteriales archaeon]